MFSFALACFLVVLKQPDSTELLFLVEDIEVDILPDFFRHFF